MNILIKNLNYTCNYGTMMMGEIIIDRISKTIKDISFFIEGAKDSDIDRLKSATNFSKIFKDTIINDKLSSNIFKKIKNKLSIFSNSIKQNKFYDYIIILGGDDYSELYFKRKIDVLLNLYSLKLLNKNNKLVMIGQTIGPYTGIREKYASRIFSKIKIYVRDSSTVEYMKNNLHVDVIESRDLAFLDLHLESLINTDEILKKYNISKNNYITIVGTGLAQYYTKNVDDFYNKYIEIIKYILNRYDNKKIVWLSHVTVSYPGISDNTMLNKLNEISNNFIKNNLIVIDEQILPAEARCILGNSYFTLTSRMHAAVSTFKMGKPAICLSYSRKYKGVIGRGLDMKDLIIEAKDDNLWKSDIIKIVKEKIDYVENNYDSLSTKINNNVNECRKIVNETLDVIINDIGKMEK